MWLKIKVFDQCLVPILSHGVETETINEIHVTQRALDKSMLRDLVPNWAGHVVQGRDGR